MRYDIVEINNQLIATIKASNAISTIEGVDVQVQVGAITAQLFNQPELQQGFIRRLPAIYIEFRQWVVDYPESEGTFQDVFHKIYYRFYVSAKSERTKKEARDSAYDLLKGVFDAIHGRVCYSLQNYAAGIPVLTGNTASPVIQITNTDFNQVQPFIEVEGNNGTLIINHPSIVVYSTDYYAKVLA